ncbi:MAG TPA: hypothetical protein VED18_11225 [Candidatus Sulfotelmatobacter sp.]|nr:hypothetical protein [Candidatus Sulfotelmatobacter sp.]
MKPISVAVLAAVLAAGLAAGCATSGQTTSSAMGYQPTQGSLGLKAEEDPAFNLGNPFRALAAVLYPVGLLFQRVVEAPYAVAMRIDPTLWGIGEAEQQYLQERWGVRPGPNPDAPPAAPGTK